MYTAYLSTYRCTNVNIIILIINKCVLITLTMHQIRFWQGLDPPIPLSYLHKSGRKKIERKGGGKRLNERGKNEWKERGRVMTESDKAFCKNLAELRLC